MDPPYDGLNSVITRKSISNHAQILPEFVTFLIHDG